MENVQAVSVVTIKAKIPLFKGEEQANAIELILLEENGFELVAGKDLYQVGDKAIYIQPDYCLPDTSLFEEFLRPGGDAKKCILGSHNRIRAKKFTLHRGDGNAVYSNGILLSLLNVTKYLKVNYFNDFDDLTKGLGVFKYEEPEKPNKQGVKTRVSQSFPLGIYKTDETNINNLWGHIESVLTYPVKLVGTEKIDGSSITFGIKNNVPFVCSRNVNKPLTYQKVVGRGKKNILDVLKFWKKPNLNIYKEVDNDDDFVKYSKKYLDVMINTGLNNIVLRGELRGKTLKGSGNKNNPAKDLSIDIDFFDYDVIDKGIAIKQSYVALIIMLRQLSEYSRVKFISCKRVFNSTFNSKEEIIKVCEDYFKENMLEGIVIKSLENPTFSCKYMNLEYDSKK